MRQAIKLVRRLSREDEGQDLVEYSLLIAFITLVCIGILNGASSSMHSIMSTLNGDLSTANSFAS